VQAPNTPIFAWRLWLAAPPEVVLEPISLTDSQALERRQIPIHPGVNAVEGYKASKDGDGLRARGFTTDHPARRRGADARRKGIAMWLPILTFFALGLNTR